MVPLKLVTKDLSLQLSNSFRSCMVMHLDKKLKWEKKSVYFLRLNLLFIKMSGKFNFCKAWKSMHQISLFAGQGAAYIPRWSSLMHLRGPDGVDGKSVLKHCHCSVWKRLRWVTLWNVTIPVSYEYQMSPPFNAKIASGWTSGFRLCFLKCDCVLTA